MSSVMSVIDFVAIMPYYIGLGLDDDNEVEHGCRIARKMCSLQSLGQGFTSASPLSSMFWHKLSISIPTKRPSFIQGILSAADATQHQL